MQPIKLFCFIKLLVLVCLPYSVFAITYTYDDLNRLVTATYQNGNAINYGYDQAGNLIKIAVKTATQVSGTVLDEAKQPVVGATVQIGGSTTTTDNMGQFAFTDLADATYQVTISNNGYTITPLTFTIDETHRNITLPNIVFSKTKNYLVIASAGENSIFIRDVPNNSVVKQFKTGTKSDQISITAVDFNQAGKDSLAVSVDNQLMIYKNLDSTVITTSDVSFPLEQFSYIATAIDSQGQSNIVVAPQPTDIAYLYTDQGKSATTLPLSAQKANFTLAMADVDGDGDLETIMGSQNSYQVTVEGTAFSVFTSDVRRATRASKKVTICHKGKNTITISENALKAHKAHGDTEGECPPKAETTSPDSETTDDNAQGVNVAAGDFDGDGKAEIVAAMAQDGSTVEIRRGDGSLITSFEAFDTGNGVIVTLGDVTNDGIADIVVGDAGDSQVKVFTFADGQVTQLSTFNIESGTIASLAVAKGIVTPTTDNASSGTTQPTDTKTTTTEQPIVTQPIENPREIYAPQCQTASDGIHISCGGNGMTLTENMTIDSLLSISDVKISGYIHNFGLLSNIVIFANATLSGGTLTGDVENYGIIMDVIFRGHKLKGGKLKGRIAILANVQLRLGIVEDVTLDEDAHLSGGRLQGKIQGSPNKPALLEDTKIADGTHLSHVIIGKGVEMGDNVIMENVSYQEADQ